MNPSPSLGRDEAANPVLDELIAKITDKLQAGEAVDVEAYAAEYPDLAEELRRLMPALEMLAVAGSPLRSEAASDEENRDPPLYGELGDFRLLREVGRGGMGVVYEAEQISLRRRVALKVLPFAATMDPRHLQRFHNEARAAASLHHPHIVPVHAVGCERAVHFYAMQFIEGKSLAELIADQKSANQGRPLKDGVETTGYGISPGRDSPAAPAPDTQAIAATSTEARPRDAASFRRFAQWGIQAAEALEHAHTLGIVHRDIKPANLIVDGQGKLWITDFGLARTLTDAGLTMSGDLLGTLRYMSPEQALARHGLVDHRTDIYSLGATLYELLTGRPVVEGQDRQLILRRIADDEPRPLRAIDRGVPADLEIIVLKALAREPTDRYATAQELADDLQRFQEDRPIRARRPSWFQRLRRWFRRRQAVVTAAALTLAVAFAVSATLIWRERDGTLSALRDVEFQRGRAEERELLARRQLYAAHIAAAQRAWEVSELGVAQRLLEQHIPQPGEEDLRGFEWYYLWGLCQGRKEARLILRGHSGEVNCAEFSPDGKLLATAGQDHTVRLWDPATGQERMVLRGHDHDVNWVAFSSDGGTLATAGDDGAVKLWDLNTGREVRQVLKASVPVIGVAFSPDGKLLAAGRVDGIVHWWELPSGRERPSFRAHGYERIESIIFAPDGRTLATSSESAKLWDTTTGKLKRLLPYSGGKANFIRFNHRGDVMAATSRSAQVQLWNPASGQRLLRLANSSGQVQSASFSADDQLLATASDDGTVRLWHTHTGKMLDLLMGHAGRVWCVAFSPDGRMLASAGKDGTVRLWDPDARRDSKVLASPPHDCALAFSPDGKRLVGGGRDENGGRLNIWEVPSGRLEASLSSPDIVLGVALAPDGRTLATGHRRGLVTVWNLDTRRPQLTFQADDRRTPTQLPDTDHLAFTADGKTLLTNGTKGRVCQWNVSTGRLERAFGLAHEFYWGLGYSPARNLVASISPAGVILWDLASDSSQPLPWPAPGARRHETVALSPDGVFLAASRENSIYLWDIAAQRVLPPLTGHRGAVGSLTFAPDGKTLASRSEDGEVKLWSVHTGQELLSLEDHRGPIRSVAFAPNGRMLATSCTPEGAKEEVHLWLTPDGP